MEKTTLGLQTDPEGFLPFEVSIALNCKEAFRFPGNFSVDFEKKRQICIRD